MIPNPIQSVNSRIKYVRELLKLSQVQFSRVLSLSSGYLAGVETEKRKVNGRLIKLVCSSFRVNDRWLKSGEGEIFNQDPDAECTKLVSLFKELSPEFQNFILKQIGLLLELQDTRQARESAALVDFSHEHATDPD
jgi:transcriptional regulator with XRE-family HTH domain